MNSTITVTAHRRPEYLKQVLDSLSVALVECPEFAPSVVVIGIDRLATATATVDDADADADADLNVVAVANDFLIAHPELYVQVIVWPERLGVNEHPRRLLQYVFIERESDYNVYLEDDTVISPDALRLALWAAQSPSYLYIRTPFLSLYNPSRSYERPAHVYKTNAFGVWGWACRRIGWGQWLAPRWNHKRDFPIGWDWSISATMERYSLQALAPSLSRVHNIGRLQGYYQTPDGYDRDFAGQVWAGREHMQRIDQFGMERACVHLT